jgi:hypothetical protein
MAAMSHSKLSNGRYFQMEDLNGGDDRICAVSSAGESM